MFYNYYKKALEDINYSDISNEFLSQMSKSLTYDNNRYIFYSDVKETLETLSKEYHTNYKLKPKLKVRNRDYHISEMRNYQKI